ncbi:MAG: riboflavin synthase [Flavobacteriales bacterium]|nr:riboflavin synthase [Flavobacteriales bacterium]|tara:strand:- start:2246 stop:2833 length:588 start_codon:yes stop_codon:yes gene_type:complete
MFTGIIENVARVVSLKKEGENLHISCSSILAREFKIDQSVSHNGVCLTVIEVNNEEYTVTAVKETLRLSNLSQLKVGDEINIERCMQLGGRLDGHIVQGHVDITASCTDIQDEGGSWKFAFKHKESEHFTVEKGSICVNGVSLTVCNSKEDRFSVAIIPYTFENTNFKNLKIGDNVNIEFDIVGKYISKMIYKDF